MASDGVFEQAPQMDAKHFRMYNSSLRVRSWSRKPMHGQCHRLTEQSPVDSKETLPVLAIDLTNQTDLVEHNILIWNGGSYEPD